MNVERLDCNLAQARPNARLTERVAKMFWKMPAGTKISGDNTFGFF
jgi:hypothetical protein